MCFLAICTSSLGKCLFRSFAHFSIGLLAFLLLSCIKLFVYFRDEALVCCIAWNHFLPFCSLSFFMVSFPSKSLSLWLGPTGLFLLWFLFLWETDLRKYSCCWCQNVLPTFSSRSLMLSCFMFKSLSHFAFIFVHGVRVCSSFIDLHVAV